MEKKEMVKLFLIIIIIFNLSHLYSKTKSSFEYFKFMVNVTANFRQREQSDGRRDKNVSCMGCN